MKTVSINLYSFDELSEQAKQKAIESLYDINVSHEWWEFTYEDAENTGLKITSFDLDRNRHAKGEFITSAPEVAEKIMQEHGKGCETYKTAANFLKDLNELTGKFENIEECPEDEIEELEEEFLKSLLEDYSIILQKESEYLQSEEAIIETIEANEYFFYEDGKLANCTTYTGGHEKTGTTELHFHGKSISI